MGTTDLEARGRRLSGTEPKVLESTVVLLQRFAIAAAFLLIFAATFETYLWAFDSDEWGDLRRQEGSNLVELRQWLVAGGAFGVSPSTPRVEVRNDLGACGCIRGIAATQPIQAEELILAVPFTHILFQPVELTAPAPTCFGGSSAWDLMLASALLREARKGRASPFRALFQTMPRDILSGSCSMTKT